VRTTVANDGPALGTHRGSQTGRLASFFEFVFLVAQHAME
jgi:hypothetical protein